MDEFDRLVMQTASELLQSEAASPGSQAADLVEAARFVLNSLGDSPGRLTRAVKSGACSPGIGPSRSTINSHDSSAEADRN